MAKRPARLHSIEDRIKKAEKICERYSQGTHNLLECCATESIAPATFLFWVQSVIEIERLYEEAKRKADQNQREQLRAKCITSLEKRIQGYEYEEVHQEYTPIYDKEGKEIGRKITKTKAIRKHVSPSDQAIFFALNSVDPERFKHNIPAIQEQEQVFLIGGKEIRF